jgi:hypothetical protein
VVELPAAGSRLGNDRVVFKDPMPLFLPTAWNSAPREWDRREPGRSFAGYGPYYVFNENDLNISLPPAIAVPARPAAALVDEAPGNPLAGMGRADMAVEPLPARWALVEVLSEASGRPVFSRALARQPGLPPEAQAAAGDSWKPLEFMAAVDAAGLVGRVSPVLRPAGSDGSGGFLQLPDEAMEKLEDYLTENLRLGARLPPGFYRIMVGP